MGAVREGPVTLTGFSPQAQQARATRTARALPPNTLFRLLMGLGTDIFRKVLSLRTAVNSIRKPCGGVPVERVDREA
jgi:hypothetical protein